MQHDHTARRNLDHAIPPKLQTTIKDIRDAAERIAMEITDLPTDDRGTAVRKAGQGWACIRMSPSQAVKHRPPARC